MEQNYEYHENNKSPHSPLLRNIINIDNNPDKKIKNPWMISTFIISIITIILLVIVFQSSVNGETLSGEEAGRRIVNYLNSRVGGGIEYVSSEDKGSLYQVIVFYQGQKIPVFCTKDGKYFVQADVPISENTNTLEPNENKLPEDIPKSDKPKIEVFVFSYCPYGLQFEKALLPVYNLLKNKIDIELVAIGAMHGEYEKQESLRQICIKKEYGKDKLWTYLEKFMGETKIGDCKDNMECSKPLVEKIMTELKIDKNKINNCIKKDAEALYNEQNERANSLGIGGSPTFVINGVETQVERTASAIKDVICSAFNTPPEECFKKLSSESETPWFGYGTASQNSTNAQC